VTVRCWVARRQPAPGAQMQNTEDPRVATLAPDALRFLGSTRSVPEEDIRRWRQPALGRAFANSRSRCCVTKGHRALPRVAVDYLRGSWLPEPSCRADEANGPPDPGHIVAQISPAERVRSHVVQGCRH
jgi:hypothetical protein